MKILQSLPKIISKNGWIVEVSRFPLRGITALRYALDHRRDSEANRFTEQKIADIAPITTSSKHISFTFAVISLSALVARADGVVSREEYLAFRDSFPLSGGICSKIRQLFLLACHNQTPAVNYAQQIKNMFPNNTELFISLVDRLFRIAIADKPLSRAEEHLLAKIAHSLGLSPSEYSILHDRYNRPLTPHVVLGVEKRSPKNIIKQRYRVLMNRYHPDRYAATDISPEVQILLTLRTSEISQAYRTLTKKAA